MPVIKYWDDVSGKWLYSATDPSDPDYVSDAGDTITGPFPLVVNSETGSYDITVDGTLTAAKFTTTKAGVLNVGIRVGASGAPGPGTVQNFGAAIMHDISDTYEGNAAVTKQSFDGLMGTWTWFPIYFTPGRWAYAGSGYTGPETFKNREGCVVMQGIVKNLVTVSAGDTEIIGTVEPSCRPLHGDVIFSTFNTTYAPIFSRVKVMKNGNVVYQGGPQLTAGNFVSLDGCSYYTT